MSYNNWRTNLKKRNTLQDDSNNAYQILETLIVKHFKSRSQVLLCKRNVSASCMDFQVMYVNALLFLTGTLPSTDKDVCWQYR